MSKTDFGFSRENTPSPEVQEFYRAQGEARAEKRIIKLLKSIAVKTKHGDIAVMELLSVIEDLVKKKTMSYHRPIGGMTVDEYIIYNKGYTVGLEIGEAITEERIIKVLDDFYPIYYPRSITTGGGEGELIGELTARIKGENK